MIFSHKAGEIRHSLSGKLVLLFIVMAIFIVILVGSGFRYFINHHFKDNVQPHIVKYLEYIQSDLGTPLNTDRAQHLANELNLEIFIITGNQQWSSNNQTLDLSGLIVKHDHTVNGKLYSLVEYEGQEYLMTVVGESTLLFAIPRLRPEHGSFRSWIPYVVILVILMLLYHGTRRLFSPIATIQSGLRRFGQGDLDHRIHINRKDELGELADNFNNMADDIQQMLDAKRQLLLAISHELRSPLTRAKLACELLDNENQKIGINCELDEMETLIEELLETERLSSRHSQLNKSLQNFNQLVFDVVKTYFVNSNIRLSLPEEEIVIEVDPARIKLLIKNLIDNAIRHTPEHGLLPQVNVINHDDSVTVQVVDHGAGIDARHLPHLTEPFYRVDPSRQRDTGGYGLGLYLCKMIAEAHKGKLLISSEPGKGTTVTLTLLMTNLNGDADGDTTASN